MIVDIERRRKLYSIKDKIIEMPRTVPDDIKLRKPGEKTKDVKKKPKGYVLKVNVTEAEKEQKRLQIAGLRRMIELPEQTFGVTKPPAAAAS